MTKRQLQFNYFHYVKSVRIRTFSGSYFPPFGLNTERYGVPLRIQPECRKIRTRKTPNTNTFHEVFQNTIPVTVVFMLKFRSHLRCSIKKGFLKNFAKFTGTLFKKKILAQVFSCEFCEIFKNTFFTVHLWTTAYVNYVEKLSISYSYEIITQSTLNANTKIKYKNI